MTGHLEVVHTLEFVERHGYALLFLWVLAEQSAFPVPSAPLLLAAGALIHAGRLQIVPALGSCMLATLVADTVWFVLGRLRGRQVLGLVCRLSLEPDSCVRRTENAFHKYGMNSLLISKFIPGLNAVAAPMAGQSNSYVRFALYDTAGALIWSGSYLAVGYAFSQQLERVIDFASNMGSSLLLLIAALAAAWIAWKYLLRRRFLRQLAVARITPMELRQRISAGQDLFIVDLRSGHDSEPTLIPGAVRIPPEELTARGRDIPRNQEIILFCS